MEISNYFKRMVITCSALLILISVIAVALYNNGPRVRYVQLSDAITTNTITNGETIRLAFDRPLQQEDYADFITLQPSADFTTQTTTQSITLTLRENLLQNTEYTISVSPGIYDKSNVKMQTEYNYSFTTEAVSYAYIERNYVDIETNNMDADDRIVLVSKAGSPETLFSHPKIRSFAINNSYAAVVVKEDDKDRLISIELASKKQSEVDIFLNVRIQDLDLSKKSNVLVFTSQPAERVINGEFSTFYINNTNRLQTVRLDDGEQWALTEQSGKPLRGTDVHIDNEAQAVLFRDDEGNYFATSPFNDYAPALVGKYEASFGFLDARSTIAFRSFSELRRYDFSSAEALPIDFKVDGYLQHITQGNTKLLASYIDISGSGAQNKVNLYEDWDAEAETIWTNENQSSESLRTFSASHDATLLALQRNTQGCQFDAMESSSECLNTKTTIYDTATQKNLDTFRGFGLIWLP